MITIIAFTKLDADKIARHFGLPVRRVLRKSDLELDYPLYRGVYYIRDGMLSDDQLITPVQAKRKWPLAHVTNERANVKWFIEMLKPIMLRKKAQMLRIAHKWMARYPDLTYDLTEREYMVGLSAIIAPGARGGIPLNDFVLARSRLKEYRYKASLNELRRLNKEAEKACQPDWFFCSECQSAKPMSEYGHFYFADTRCKDCVTPEWLRRAKAENYN